MPLSIPLKASTILILQSCRHISKLKKHVLHHQATCPTNLQRHILISFAQFSKKESSWPPIT